MSELLDVPSRVVATTKRHRWGILWRSDNRLDGRTRHLMYSSDTSLPILFKARREAREYIENRYGYIRHRKDLHEEPHGWKLPKPVKVDIITRSEGRAELSITLEIAQ
jgi:hypothetical protein